VPEVSVMPFANHKKKREASRKRRQRKRATTETKKVKKKLMITNSKKNDGSGLRAKPNKVKTFNAWIFSDENGGNRAYAKDNYSVYL
jgi:hypothetical protein